MMLLYSQNGDLGTAIFTCVMLFVVAGVIGLIYAFGLGTKETIKMGGIKGCYPNLIKFLVQNYPNARVITDTKFYMCIESFDAIKGVTFKFSLRLNPESRDLKIVGTIIPDNSKWAWIPNTEHVWKLETKYGPGYSEGVVIKRIKEDMVFNPTE